MKTKVLGFAAIGIAAITLSAFVYAKKSDDDKKKKYQVIHQKDGVLQEFDTIIPSNSNYSVEDFLKEKGIENENVEIINIKTSSLHDHFMSFHGSDGEEITISELHKDMEWEHDGEMVKIIMQEDDKGEIKMKKYVNGEEVEISEEEIEMLKEQKHGHRIVVKEHGDVEENVIIEEDGKKIKIIVEEKDGGSPNEFEHVELDIDGDQIKIEIDGEELSKELEEAMKELKLEMEELDLDLENLFQNIDIDIENIISEEGTRENHKIIVNIDGDMKELHEEMENLMIDLDHMDFTELHKNIRVHGDDEDFTIVIVSELGNNEAIETAVRKEVKTSKEEMKLYPNPNDGTFTIAFDQSEKESTKIEVINSEGKIVFKEKLGKFSGAYKKELNLKEHGSGTYMVKIHRGNDVTTHKVVIE